MADESEQSLAKFLRLKNGDDVVSEIVEMEDDEGIMYVLINPLKVVYIPTASGNLQIAFVPWVFVKIVDHQEFTIRIDDILLLSNVSEYMNDYYWKNITTYTGGDKEHEYVSDQESEQESDQSTEEESSLIDKIKEMVIKRTYH
jgi:hypothetical protein